MKGPNLRKSLGTIKAKDFQWIEEDDEEVLAYVIEPFIYKIPDDTRATVTFECGKFTATDEIAVGIPLRKQYKKYRREHRRY